MLRFAPVFALVLLFGILPAHAESTEDKLANALGGTIIMSSKGFPKTLTSASSVKKLHQNKYAYDKDGKATIRYLVFLKKAIAGVASDVTLLDITDGLPGKVILTSSFLTSDRGQRIYSSYLQLDEQKVPGDRKYRLVFSYQGYVIAKGDFFIKARPVKREGKVDFSEEEVK